MGCTKNGIKTELDAFILSEHDWDTVRSVLVGEREPDVLRHLTRVVGYYSSVSNWSESTCGELKDRIKGNYGCGDMGDSAAKERRMKVANSY